MSTKITKLTLWVAVSLAFSTATLAQIPAQVQVHMNEFVRAFNTGDSVSIRDFVLSTHHPEVLKQVPEAQLSNRLMWVYYQYGPLEPQEYISLNETSACLWSRGKLTKSWMGVVFFFTKNAPHKITTIGIERGSFPPEGKRLRPARNRKDLVAKVEECLRDMENTPFFSGSVLIAHKGKILYQKHSGWADVKQKALIQDDTRFFIASISKMFVGTAILQLQEQGKLAFDDVLSKFIPEYPKNIAEKVTIHHLLTHTSGIELDEIPEFNKAEAKSIKELVDLQVRFVPQVPELLDYHLPTEYNYSNEGYALLARIVEVASGLDYWEYVRQNILAPCGIKNTAPCPINRFPENTALGYTNRRPEDGGYKSAQLEERKIISNSVAHPAGGVVSTAEDLWAFAKKLFSGKLISPSSLKTMTTQQVSIGENVGYGYGLSISETPAGLLWGHSGDLIGYNSRLDFYPESGYTIIVLANKDQAAKNIADYIKEVLSK